MKKLSEKDQRFLINVPQGRAARLIKRINYLNIEGLYSDGFSSCNLVAIVGAERISLMHVDHQLLYEPNVVEGELAWVKKTDPECRVEIYYHHLGKALATTLANKVFDKVRCDLRLVGDEMIGIKVSFEHGIEEHYSREAPANVLRHPEEQRFNAAHKMEQFLFLSDQTTDLKQRVVYDARCWRPMFDGELRPSCQTDATKNYMSRFNSRVPMIEIAVTMSDILHELKSQHKNIVIVESNMEFCLSNAVNFFEYLNDFNSVELFYLNMHDTVTSRKSFIQTKADQILFNLLDAALKDKNTAFEVCEKLVAQCKSTTQFQKHICAEFNMHLERHRLHVSYNRMAQFHQEARASAKKLAAKALQEFRNGNLPAAINLYEESLLLLSHSSYCNDINLATVNYCLGRCYFKNNEFDKATEFLETALALRIHYHPEDKAGLEKVENACQECRDQQSENEVMLSATGSPQKI